MDGAGITIETKLGGTRTSFSTRKIEPSRTSFSRSFSHCFENKHFIKDFCSSHVS